MRCTPSTSSPLQPSHRTRNPLFVLDRPPTPNHHARSASCLLSLFFSRLLCLLRAELQAPKATTRPSRSPLPPRFQDSFQGTDSLRPQPTPTPTTTSSTPSRPPAIVILPQLLPPLLDSTRSIYNSLPSSLPSCRLPRPSSAHSFMAPSSV
jgi:hypothetical protein